MDSAREAVHSLLTSPSCLTPYAPYNRPYPAVTPALHQAQTIAHALLPMCRCHYSHISNSSPFDFQATVGTRCTQAWPSKPILPHIFPSAQTLDTFSAKAGGCRGVQCSMQHLRSLRVRALCLGQAVSQRCLQGRQHIFPSP